MTKGLRPVALQVPGASATLIEPFVPVSTDLLVPLELVKTTVPGSGRAAVTPLASKTPDTEPGGVDRTTHPDASARRETDEQAKTLWHLDPNISFRVSLTVTIGAAQRPRSGDEAQGSRLRLRHQNKEPRRTLSTIATSASTQTSAMTTATSRGGELLRRGVEPARGDNRPVVLPKRGVAPKRDICDVSRCRGSGSCAADRMCIVVATGPPRIW